MGRWLLAISLWWLLMHGHASCEGIGRRGHTLLLQVRVLHLGHRRSVLLLLLGIAPIEHVVAVVRHTQVLLLVRERGVSAHHHLLLLSVHLVLWVSMSLHTHTAHAHLLRRAAIHASAVQRQDSIRRGLRLGWCSSRLSEAIACSEVARCLRLSLGSRGGQHVQQIRRCRRLLVMMRMMRVMVVRVLVLYMSSRRRSSESSVEAKCSRCLGLRSSMLRSRAEGTEPIVLSAERTEVLLQLLLLRSSSGLVDDRLGSDGGRGMARCGEAEGRGGLVAVAHEVDQRRLSSSYCHGGDGSNRLWAGSRSRRSGGGGAARSFLDRFRGGDDGAVGRRQTMCHISLVLILVTDESLDNAHGIAFLGTDHVSRHIGLPVGVRSPIAPFLHKLSKMVTKYKEGHMAHGSPPLACWSRSPG